MKKMWVSASVVTVACLTLAGCGGAPSEGQIKAAIEAQLQQQQKAVAGMLGAAAGTIPKDMLPEVTNVRKIGCTADGEKAYRCDVELEMKLRGNVTKTPPRPVRLVKGSDGWAVAM